MLSGFTRSELTDREAFSNRAVAALDDEDVRLALSERVVGELARSVSPELLTVRPLVVSAVAALADTPVFKRGLARALAARHRRVFEGRRGVAVELGRGAALVLDAVRGLSPRAAEALPARPQLSLTVLEPQGFELTTARALERVAGWWWWLVAATLASAAACALLARGARRALAHLGVAAALAGLICAAGVALLGELFVSHAANAAGLAEEHEREAFGALWSALFGDLLSTALLLALAGTLLAALAAGPSLSEYTARAGRLMRSPAPVARAGRAALLVAAGALLVLEPGPAGRVLLVLGGLLLVLLGVIEATGRAARRGPAGERPGAGLGPLAAAAAAVLVLLAVAVVLVLPGPPAISGEAVLAPRSGCNGSRALCARRLNELIWPSTHNSYAAADEPGWLFANQRFGIERQLEDGVRGLLIDVHFGVRDPASGRIRTDLRYEGSSRNKVARELSPEALRTADALAGRVGLGELGGERRPYLCHTLCELGAEPLDEQLEIVARFLDTHPGAVLIVFVEPYVPVDVVETGLREAGLLAQAARLRRDRPLPTLGTLVRRRTRLVVLAEQDGGEHPWYLPGFSFAQDTPYQAATPSQLSCSRFRGDPDSPLFLLNHWIATFPPSPSRNARIGGDFLRERIERCERRRDRLPNLVAVDFYENSGVVEIAKRLNGG